MTVRGVSAVAAVVVAAGLAVAGFVVALWPLHTNGVTGIAIAPRYHPFDVGVTSYQPLPEHVTIAGGLVTAGAGGMSTAAVRAGRRGGGGSPAG